MTINYVDSVLEPVLTTYSPIYVAPAVTAAHIAYAEVYNYSEANTRLTINIAQSGDSVSSSNEYYSGIITAKTPVVLYELVNRVLKQGDTIYAVSAAGDSLNLSIGIKED